MDEYKRTAENRHGWPGGDWKGTGRGLERDRKATEENMRWIKGRGGFLPSTTFGLLVCTFIHRLFQLFPWRYCIISDI